MSVGSLVRDLSTLPIGIRVFVDTMIFDLALRGKSFACQTFLARVTTSEVIAYVNYQVLSDLLHKLMLAEAVVKGYIKDRRALDLKRWLAADRTRGTNLTDYQTQFENMLAIGLKVLRISKKTFIETYDERKNHGLMTGDP